MASNLPVLSGEAGLSRYLDEINRFPFLTQEEELLLATNWRDRGDVEAAHTLVTSHLRLVAKIAMGFRGYGLPLMEMISEGNIGLMHAVKKFNPDRGFRLSTYAMWWIKASIQEYVLRSWSLVKIGTTTAQKKLFFNLRRLKSSLHKLDNLSLSPSDAKHIAEALEVTEQEVFDMDIRMSRQDMSLNDPLSGDNENGGEWIDMLADTRANQETNLIESSEQRYKRALFAEAFSTLSQREREIVTARRLQEPPATLEDLSQDYKISRERIRQIENRALEKVIIHIKTAQQKAAA
jgi:RNA polymerase sigma-32 factor